MKYCHYCNADNPNNANYCHKCGKKINNELIILYFIIGLFAIGIVGMFIPVLLGLFGIGISKTIVLLFGGLSIVSAILLVIYSLFINETK